MQSSVFCHELISLAAKSPLANPIGSDIPTPILGGMCFASFIWHCTMINV